MFAERAGGRRALAGARVDVATAVGTAAIRPGAGGVEAGQDPLQLTLERRLVGDLAAQLADPAAHERTELVLERFAFAGEPGLDQGGHVVEAHPEPLGPPDEREPLDGAVVVEAVAGPERACGRTSPIRS